MAPVIEQYEKEEGPVSTGQHPFGDRQEQPEEGQPKTIRKKGRKRKNKGGRQKRQKRDPTIIRTRSYESPGSFYDAMYLGYSGIAPTGREGVDLDIKHVNNKDKFVGKLAEIDEES